MGAEVSISGAATLPREDYHDLVRTDVLPLVPPGTGVLLDIGGGVGGTALHARNTGLASKVGVIDQVVPREVDFSYLGDLERGDLVERAALENGPFDTILALDILEHLVDPWAMVRRMTDALAPGGVIVASIPNVRHYSALGPLVLRNRWSYCNEGILDRTHLRFFVRSTAIELMTSHGLVLEEVRANMFISRKLKLVRRACLGMIDSILTLQYLIRVRKLVEH